MTAVMIVLLCCKFQSSIMDNIVYTRRKDYQTMLMMSGRAHQFLVSAHARSRDITYSAGKNG